MNRTIMLAFLLLFAVENTTANAQTAWVHINHPKAGNFVITPVDLKHSVESRSATAARNW